MQQPNFPTPPLAIRVLFAVFGFIFAGIGVAVLVFLWSASGWDAPPLFFRVFGSFIAFGFVAFGGTMAFSFLKPRAMLPRQLTDRLNDPAAAPTPLTSYACPHCGATLGKEADVSPLGDVKCSFCARWFNIHKSA